MKFFKCQKCNSEYSYEEATVKEMIENNTFPKCEKDNETLTNVSLSELKEAFRKNIETEVAKEEELATFSKSSRVKIVKEDGKAYVEFDGKKLLITGPIRFQTVKGEVSIQP